MTASDLLHALHECGATVGVDGDELVVKAPRGALSPDLRVALARLKPTVMAELKNRDTPDNIDELTEWPGTAVPPTTGHTARGADTIDALTECRPQPRAPEYLPPVHDVDDPWAKPTAPCMVCGQTRWRVWSDDNGASWQRIYNGCRPLVVINPDGTRWRS